MARSIPVLTASVTTSPPSSPALAVLKPYYSKSSYVSYKDDETVVLAEEEGVFNPRAKIAVEIAQKVESGKTFVNLRCCYSNRYIGRKEGSVIPIAVLKQPDEDTTKTTSTLFELRHYYDTESYSNYFCHVQSQQFLIINEALDTLEINDWTSDERLFFQIVDWDSLVKLPSTAAFKGENGSYLIPYSYAGNQYLQFASSDPTEDAVQEVEQLSDGSVKIKSLSLSFSWRNSGSSGWIWADSVDASTTDPSLLFWPAKPAVGDNSAVALRSSLNNNFCKRFTTGSIVSCLAAATPTVDKFAKLVVQELVSERKITNVTYRMDDARIYDEKSYTAGSATAINDTDAEAYISVKLTYTTTVSYSFSNSTPLNTGVTPTIQAYLLRIARGSIEISTHEISTSFEWGQTTSIEITVYVWGTVLVQPYTTAIVNYVGTLGTYDVPFNYQQQDKSSTGKTTTTDKDDGVYTGVNAYDFSFQIESSKPL